MKIQCACGAKYSFDATPEMVQNPVRLVCQGCGADLSGSVNEMVRQAFAGQTPAAGPPPVVPRLKISHSTPVPSVPAEAAEPVQPAAAFCPRHPREAVAHFCLVCGRPMCAQCMKLFGYVCSPRCRAQAEAKSMDIPVFEGQTAVAEARYWRKLGIVGALAAILILVGAGFWTWYAWFGSVPHVAFSVRFDDRAYAGQSKLCGTNQIVFLHGGTLARYDIKSGRQIWSDELVTKQQIADVIAQENAAQPTDEFERRIPQSQLEASAALALEGALRLQVIGQNVWVATPGKLTRYDWDTGKVAKEIPVDAGEFIEQNGEFLTVGEGARGQALVTHINPATGESRVEEIIQPGQVAIAPNPAGAAAGGTGNQATGGLPLTSGAGGTGPLNPAKVAEQAQNMGTPGKIALPALLANSAEQERIATELKDQEQGTTGGQSSSRKTAPSQSGPDRFTLIPSPSGYVEFGVKLLQLNIVTRDAMKAPPKKSALDSNVGVMNETAAINEQLNEIQRTHGGDTVQEDESRYRVTLRRPDSTGAADWTGEVTGPPALFPLKTVNVLAAGKTLIVFDKTNKKLWDATLTYNVEGGNRGMEPGASSFGDGPVAERNGTLYVFDQAVLTAFDLATGNARWRLPSVGVVGLFFDDRGMLYVNTTTADPENVKYSRQIDVSQKIEAILLKVDPQTGKTLWSTKPGGFISYLSGKFIYTVQSYDPGDVESPSGIQFPPYVKIRRISPSDGHVLWEHDQDRAPLDVQFQNNSIGVVFKKEVQVLKFLAF